MSKKTIRRKPLVRRTFTSLMNDHSEMILHRFIKEGAGSMAIGVRAAMIEAMRWGRDGAKDKLKRKLLV